MLPSLILLSGGLDSLYALVIAKEQGSARLALTFDYGHKARAREIDAARRACATYNIEHRVVDLPFVAHSSNHPLFADNSTCPQLMPDELDNRTKTDASAKAVWVPNRNGVFLNVAAALAEAQGIGEIYTGFNAEEGVTFPDNSAGYVSAVNDSLGFSTLNNVKVVAPALHLTKAQIARELQQRDFDFTLVWSCYLGGEKMCGRCESCLRLNRALTNNDSPTLAHRHISTSAQSSPTSTHRHIGASAR